MSEEKDDKTIVGEFFQNLYDSGYGNKMFYSQPIAESRDEAYMDANVELFLTNSYEASGNEDEDFVDSFMDRLYYRLYG